MSPIILIVAGVALVASLGASAKFGHDLGQSTERAAWQKKFADANKEHAEAKRKADDAIRAKDLETQAALSAKEQELRDRNNELEAARNQTPLAADCASCRVPRSHVERMRQGAAASGAQSNGTGTSPGRADGASNTGQMSAK